MARELRMWTIYDHPVDHPDGFAVREFRVVPGASVAGPLLGVAASLEEARALLPDCAEVRLGRDVSDDPKIVETWI